MTIQSVLPRVTYHALYLKTFLNHVKGILFVNVSGGNWNFTKMWLSFWKVYYKLMHNDLSKIIPNHYWRMLCDMKWYKVIYYQRYVSQEKVYVSMWNLGVLSYIIKTIVWKTPSFLRKLVLKIFASVEHLLEKHQVFSK